jgi:anti-sigma B factor antagonist
VGVSGELDMATAPRLADVFSRIDGPIVVDCRSLTFVDSAGLLVLAEAHRDGGGLTLRRLTRNCRRIIEVVGLTDLIAPEERQRANAATDDVAPIG